MTLLRKGLLMYCQHCGKEIDDKAVICIHCGCQVKTTQPDTKKENNGCLIGCLVTFLILSAIGIIFFVIVGTIGLNAANDAINQETGQNSSALYKMMNSK